MPGEVEARADREDRGEAKAMRELAQPWRFLVECLGVAMAAYYLHAAGFGVPAPQWHRGLYVLLTFGMAFLLFPARRGAPSRRPSAPDLGLAVLSACVVGYWIWEYEALASRPGAYTRLDLWVSVAGVILALEVARRGVGIGIPILSLACLGFAYLGPYVPGPLAHRGFSVERIATYLFLTNDGVFGVLADAIATYVLVFVFFGAFMRRSGAGQFFIDLPMALMGSTAGGPAKVAVVSSAIFGTVSGSAVANVVGTGTFTIPLMKRTGYRPHVAGAVETAASTGGQIMPPVMGAAAFVIAEITGISYWYIALVSAIPAVLYFLSVGMMVHLEAKKQGIRGFPRDELPRLGRVLREGWYHLLPLAALVLLMALLYSPFLAAFWATAATVATTWVRRDGRMGPRAIWQAGVEGARGCLIVGATVGAVGIVVGVINLTGLALKFSSLVLSLSGGSLLIALGLVCAAAFVLGMGMPTTPAYLILAVLAVPALAELNVPVLAAHLIVFWYSLNSGFTPPVCVAAYAAAAIARSDPWKTGWYAFNYAKILFLVPLLFAYTPLLMTGSAWENLWAILAATTGTVAMSHASMFYLLHRTTAIEWLLLSAATVLCFDPGFVTDLLGFGCLAGAYASQKLRQRRARAADLAVSPGA
jgi:TRAP transporter 4TM/12TM fusion protein